MQIYIATDDGGKQGPLFLHQIETMIREGTVQPSQLGWHRDLSDWIPLREIPAVRELLESREREEIKAKLDKESADGTVITRAQVEDAARGRSVLPTKRIWQDSTSEVRGSFLTSIGCFPMVRVEYCLISS